MAYPKILGWKDKKYLTYKRLIIKPKGDEYIVGPYLRQMVENI